MIPGRVHPDRLHPGRVHPGRLHLGLHPAAILLLAFVPLACATGQGAGDGSVQEAGCSEGLLQVSGADPFPELALVRSDGSTLGIAYDATDLPALGGTTVRLCTVGASIERGADIDGFELLAVEGTPAVLGRLRVRPIDETGTDDAIGVWLVTAADPVGVRVLGGGDVVREAADRCAWIAGEIGEGDVRLESFGQLPTGLCDLADRVATKGIGFAAGGGED